MMPIFEILLPKMKPNGLFIFGGDPEVCRQVEALIGSLDDTLEDEFVLEEMRALKKSGMPFQETFADVADR